MRLLPIFGLLSILPAFAQKQPITLDSLQETAPGSIIASLVWTDSGDRFLFTDRGTLSVYDVKSGKQKSVIGNDRLVAAAKKIPEGLMDWTNRRASKGVSQWFKDNRRVLVSAGGDLFIVDTEKDSLEALTQTSEAEVDPRLSPDNRLVSFVRAQDLWIIDVATKKETRLTTNGGETLLNGEPDWIYPEELELSSAQWWSPDSASIAYLQFDLSSVPSFPQVSLLNPRGQLEPERYPKAGDPNPRVRLGVIAVSGGATKWMDLGDPTSALLARVVWSPNSRDIMAVRLNRVQNQLDLMLVNAASGEAHSILHETDKYWINVTDAPRFLGNGDRFLWSSESSGFRHLYLYSSTGELQKQLTSGDWMIDKIAGVDEKHSRVFFTSTETSALERQFYSVDFNGTRERLTQSAGTHNPSLAPDGATFFDETSSLTSPPSSTVSNAEGHLLHVFHKPDNTYSDQYEILPSEIVQVKTADGAQLYARMIRPAGFRAGGKYPAVVMIYGGPHPQQVRNIWPAAPLEQVLAQNGFVVWQLDNRGSGGRGHAFESAVYHNMGAQELADQKEGIAYLVKLGFVDETRVGMYGWSYGGYMSLYTATNAPGLLRAAVAGAPVTDWRNYDSIYTERYMGLPEENPEGYKSSAPVAKAAAMNGTKLLLLHNVEDDNVHFQNTIQMAAALEAAGKQFSMVVYPQKQHGVTGVYRRQMQETVLRFFEENLGQNSK